MLAWLEEAGVRVQPGHDRGGWALEGQGAGAAGAAGAKEEPGCRGEVAGSGDEAAVEKVQLVGQMDLRRGSESRRRNSMGGENGWLWFVGMVEWKGI